MSTYKTIFSIKRLWIILSLGMVVMFGILGLLGREIYQQIPPIPSIVKSTSGEVIFTRADIERGQNVWQSIGGMQQGSIWGHGSYLAPDWSADWLHREALALLTIMMQQPIAAELTEAQKNALHKSALQTEMRRNTFDPADGTITVTENRTKAIKAVTAHFSRLYEGTGAEALSLRRKYAFPLNSLLSQSESHALSAFYFWTAWCATTQRPGAEITYTSNWPHEPLVGNRPSTGILMWSLVSVILLLAGVGALVWYYAKQFDVWQKEIRPEEGTAKTDFMEDAIITPSMRATAKYFWIVCVLFALQVLLGIVTAHYAVEGQGLYGLPFAEYFPYSVTRTWHTQLVT